MLMYWTLTFFETYFIREHGHMYCPGKLLQRPTCLFQRSLMEKDGGEAEAWAVANL